MKSPSAAAMLTASDLATVLYSLAADVHSGPVLLERQPIGNINRGMAWSPDSKRIVFSSER